MTESSIKILRNALAAIPPMTLGSVIRDRRERRSISHSEFADVIGCSIETLAEIEAGQSQPTETQMDRISAELSIARHLLDEISSAPKSH